MQPVDARMVNPTYLQLLEAVARAAFIMRARADENHAEFTPAVARSFLYAMESLDERRVDCYDADHPNAYEEIVSGTTWRLICPDCGYQESRPIFTECGSCGMECPCDDAHRCELCKLVVCPLCLEPHDHRCPAFGTQ
jgi:hypothetical protein